VTGSHAVSQCNALTYLQFSILNFERVSSCFGTVETIKILTMAPPTEAQGKSGAEEEPQVTQDADTIQILLAVNPYKKKKTDPPPPPPQAQNVFQFAL
jgi:hypothetical protein